jgi:pimeloyl-ACP methyl ester carboxylesterase
MSFTDFARLALVGTALTISIAVTSRADQRPTPPSGWTDGYVIANGIRIHYWRTGGDKPVMVLAHGSSDDGLCWTNFAKELTDDYDIIMFDARGHGLSDPPSKSDPSDVQAEDLAALVRALKLEKPILMGHSMGSSSVARCSAKYPDLPSAVILEDPRLIPRSPDDPRASPTAESQERRRNQVLERNNKSYEQLVAECMERSPSWGRSECECWAPSKRLHHPNTAYRRFGDRPPMGELFTKIIVPTLILKADASDSDRKKNEQVAKVLQNGTLVHIDGAGHNVRREQKASLLKSLNAFLAEL